MKIEIENLKGLVFLKDMTDYQKSLAINELNKLIDYINELEQINNNCIADVMFSFDELKTKILKSKAKSEYKQAFIVILRSIFEEN